LHDDVFLKIESGDSKKNAVTIDYQLNMKRASAR